MQFVTLTSEEFETFAQAHFSHYTQSVPHYLFRERQGVAHLVGVKDDQQNVIAACLLTEARCLKFFKWRCVKLKLKFLQKNCNFFRNKLKNIKRSDIEDKFIRIFLPPQITPL